MNTKRQWPIDVLRIAATCAVVFLHTLTGFVDHADLGAYPAHRITYLVLMDLITWCVPVFVMISGYFFLDPSKKITMREMLGKYMRRIVLALVLFGVPFALLKLLMTEGTFRPDMLWRSVVLVLTGRTWSHMWYLYLILGLYLITPLLKKVLAKIPGASVYLVLLFLLVGGSLMTFAGKFAGDESLWHLSDTSIYLFYYLVGYLFAVGGKRGAAEGGSAKTDNAEADNNAAAAEAQREKRRKMILPLSIAVLMAAMAISRLTGRYGLQMAYNYPPNVLVSVLLMKLAVDRRAWMPAKSKFIGKLSGLCFAVYLIHPVFLNVLYKGLHFDLLAYPFLPVLVMVYVPVIILSFLAAWIMSLIGPLKKYVL